MKIKCYYHEVDLDGKCSAAIVKRKYPECELIGVNYPDRPDFDKIEKNEKVFIVDFSFSAEDMYDLLCICNENLIWIDHHKSAIQKVAEYTLSDNHAPLTAAINGKREIDKAGCELTWEYLFSDESMPETVRLLGRYDVWDHSDPRVLPFQYGMRLKVWEPEDVDWKFLFNIFNTKVVPLIIIDGDAVLRYEVQRNTTYAKSMAFPVKFEGHKAWAINKALSNSKVFEALEKAEDRPLWILFSYKAGIWRYSIYSAPDSGLDVSKIAVKYGGGGHAGAAGFQSNEYLLTEAAT